MDDLEEKFINNKSIFNKLVHGCLCESNSRHTFYKDIDYYEYAKSFYEKYGSCLEQAVGKDYEDFANNKISFERYENALVQITDNDSEIRHIIRQHTIYISCGYLALKRLEKKKNILLTEIENNSIRVKKLN